MLKPATKYLTNTIDQQLAYIIGELSEAHEIIMDIKQGKITLEEAKQALVMEFIDTQTAITTMLHGPLGMTRSEVLRHERMVEDKNRGKGHYDKVVTSMEVNHDRSKTTI